MPLLVRTELHELVTVVPAEFVAFGTPEVKSAALHQPLTAPGEESAPATGPQLEVAIERIRFALGVDVNVFDGGGNFNLFNVKGANYNYFEGITFRNTQIRFSSSFGRSSDSSSCPPPRRSWLR